MQVVVELATEAREDLVRLLEGRTLQPADALVAAIVYTEDIIRTLETHEGPPPGATVRRYAHREEVWWNYADGIWVEFTVATRLTWLRRQAERTIRVESVASQPDGP